MRGIKISLNQILKMQESHPKSLGHFAEETKNALVSAVQSYRKKQAVNQSLPVQPLRSVRQSLHHGTPLYKNGCSGLVQRVLQACKKYLHPYK